MCWAATTTLSHPTIWWEIFITFRRTSALLLVSRLADKMVLCWQDLGEGFSTYNCNIFHIRDRQYCHCGNVEPPIDLNVSPSMCGDECPPSEWSETSSEDPWATTMFEPCGTTHYTMVRIGFIKTMNAWTTIYLHEKILASGVCLGYSVNGRLATQTRAAESYYIFICYKQ